MSHTKHLISGLLAMRFFASLLVLVFFLPCLGKGESPAKSEADGANAQEARRSALVTLQTMIDFTAARHGENDPQVAILVVKRATIFAELGEWRDALASAELAVEKLEIEPHESPIVNKNAKKLVAEYRLYAGLSPGQPEKLIAAKELFAEGLSAYRKGNAEEALNLLNRCLALQLEVFKLDNPYLEETRILMANTAMDLGDFATAIPLLEANIQEDSGLDPAARRSAINNLAIACGEMGDYLRMRDLLQQLLAEIDPKDRVATLDAITLRVNLSNCYYNLGDTEEAFGLLQGNLVGLRRLGMQERQEYATALNGIGLLAVETADYDYAESALREAASLLIKIGRQNSFEYAACQTNLGLMYYKMGNYPAAVAPMEAAKQTALAIGGGEHPGLARIVGNLALIYASNDNFAAAEENYQLALDFAQRQFGATSLEAAKVTANRGLMRYFQGDFIAAEADYMKVIEILKHTWGDHRELLAATYGNLGSLYAATGASKRAAVYQRRAFDFKRELLESLASVQTERQQLRLAKSTATTLDAYLTTMLSLPQASDAAYQAVVQWKGGIHVRQRFARLAASDPQIMPLFHDLQELTRQWAQLAQQPGEDRAAWRREVDQLAAQKKQLEIELSQRSKSLRVGDACPAWQEIAAALPPSAVLVDYLVYSRSIYPNDATTPSEAAIPSLEESLVAFVVQRATTGDEPRVEMFDLGRVAPMEEAIDVWRASLGSGRDAQIAGERLRTALWAPLAASIGDAEQVLISPDGPLGRLPFAALPGKLAGSYLIEDHNLVMTPVPRLLPGPSESESLSPVENALLVFGGINYDRTASDNSSGELVQINAREAATSGPRSYAGEGSWAYLSGTDAEASYVAEVYGGQDDAIPVVYRTGAEATEAAFRREAPNCRVIHLATHGYFSPPKHRSALRTATTTSAADRLIGTADQGASNDASEAPPGLLSGIVFAGANAAQVADQHDDGLLTAAEIAYLPLGDVRLVVLSACETGLGKVAGGEGLLGLQRAFQISGTRATIASLWKVDDNATRAIMQEFYRNYVERKQPASVALRNAQVWAMDNLAGADGAPRGMELVDSTAATDGKEQVRLAPRYWAAFSLSGDWR